MKARSMVIFLVTCFVALTWCFARDAMMGTWKLNEAKSKIGARSENNTVMIEASGENVVPKLHRQLGLPKYWLKCRRLPRWKQQIVGPALPAGMGNSSPESAPD